MEPILLFSKQSPLVTAVSNTFIEEYMPEANGSFVKLYLYLSMCMQCGSQSLSISSLADCFSNTEADILRALHYWENKKLLELSYSKSTGELIGITLLEPSHKTNAQQSLYQSPSQTPDNLYDKPHAEPIHISDYIPSDMRSAHDIHNTSGMHMTSDLHNTSDIRVSPDAHDTSDIRMSPDTHNAPSSKKRQVISVSDEQAKELASDSEFIWTSHVLENYLNRPLNPAEVQLISYLYGTLGFSSDLLLYLYEYCISLGKTNPNYIQAVALSWDEKQVHTPEDAKSASSGYNSTYIAVSKAFALGRTLASIEKEYVDRWKNEWNMDLSVILEACNRTMLKISKADFKYAEGILDNWHKAAIHTMQEVEKADEIYARQKAKRQTDNIKQTGSRNRNQFQAFAQRNTSQSEVEALERKLLMR